MCLNERLHGSEMYVVPYGAIGHISLIQLLETRSRGLFGDVCLDIKIAIVSELYTGEN